VEQFKLPNERKEHQTLDTLDTGTLIEAYCTSKESLQRGAEMSEVDVMLDEWFKGNQEAVDAYFESLED